MTDWHNGLGEKMNTRIETITLDGKRLPLTYSGAAGCAVEYTESVGRGTYTVVEAGGATFDGFSTDGGAVSFVFIYNDSFISDEAFLSLYAQSADNDTFEIAQINSMAGAALTTSGTMATVTEKGVCADMNVESSLNFVLIKNSQPIAYLKNAVKTTTAAPIGVSSCDTYDINDAMFCTRTAFYMTSSVRIAAAYTKVRVGCGRIAAGNDSDYMTIYDSSLNVLGEFKTDTDCALTSECIFTVGSSLRALTACKTVVYPIAGTRVYALEEHGCVHVAVFNSASGKATRLKFDGKFTVIESVEATGVGIMGGRICIMTASGATAYSLSGKTKAYPYAAMTECGGSIFVDGQGAYGVLSGATRTGATFYRGGALVLSTRQLLIDKPTAISAVGTVREIPLDLDIDGNVLAFVSKNYLYSNGLTRNSVYFETEGGTVTNNTALSGECNVKINFRN